MQQTGNEALVARPERLDQLDQVHGPLCLRIAPRVLTGVTLCTECWLAVRRVLTGWRVECCWVVVLLVVLVLVFAEQRNVHQWLRGSTSRIGAPHDCKH